MIDIEHLEHRAPQLIVRLLLLELLRQRAYEGRVAHMIHLGNAADQRAIEADDERVHRRDECDIAAAWEMTATKGDSERGPVHLGGIPFGQLRYFITHTSPAGAGSGAVSLRPSLAFFREPIACDQLERVGAGHNRLRDVALSLVRRVNAAFH